MYNLLQFINTHFKKLMSVIFLLAGLSANAQFSVYSFSYKNDSKTSIKYSKTGFDRFSLKYEGELLKVTILHCFLDNIFISGFLEFQASIKLLLK